MGGREKRERNGGEKDVIEKYLNHQQSVSRPGSARKERTRGIDVKTARKGLQTVLTRRRKVDRSSG